MFCRQCSSSFSLIHASLARCSYLLWWAEEVICLLCYKKPTACGTYAQTNIDGSSSERHCSNGASCRSSNACHDAPHFSKHYDVPTLTISPSTMLKAAAISRPSQVSPESISSKRVRANGHGKSSCCTEHESVSDCVCPAGTDFKRQRNCKTV